MASVTIGPVATINGTQAFPDTIAIPISGSQAIVATEFESTDAAGNVYLNGFLLNNVATAVTPTLEIPANPTAGQVLQLPDGQGGTIVSTYVGQQSVTEPAGSFTAAVWSQTSKSGSDVVGYAKGVGIVEIDYPSFQCRLSSYTLH